MRNTLLSVLLLLPAAMLQAAAIYQCVDAAGNVQFSDGPVEGLECTRLGEAPAPSAERRREAQRIAEETERLTPRRSDTVEEAAGSGVDKDEVREVALSDTVSSKYLLGRGAGWLVDEGEARANILFRVSEDARTDGVYVEARFPNPGRGADFLDGATGRRGESVMLQGQPSSQYECGAPYTIRVRVYPTARKLRVIDQLNQVSVIAPVVCDLLRGS